MQNNTTITSEACTFNLDCRCYLVIVRMYSGGWCMCVGVAMGGCTVGHLNYPKIVFMCQCAYLLPTLLQL